jgi:hypothetical protein
MTLTGHLRPHPQPASNHAHTAHVFGYNATPLHSTSCYPRLGLVLDWVYGSIVSTAEKARDGAKRQLGMRPPSVEGAFAALLGCLEDQAHWEARVHQAKALLKSMLESRKEADELVQQYDMRPVPAAAAPAGEAGDVADSGEASGAAASGSNGGGWLPDSVILKMLAREELLTQAKLAALKFENMTNHRMLQTVKSQIRHVSLAPPAHISFLVFQCMSIIYPPPSLDTTRTHISPPLPPLIPPLSLLRASLSWSG